MAQLKMILRCREAAYPTENEHFTYRVFRNTEEDIQTWIDICKNGILKEESGFEEYERRMLKWRDFKPENIFLIEKDGKAVATITGIIHPDEQMGYVHMVASLPECRGLGVGDFMNNIVMASFWEHGCKTAYLTTDEFRVPAIKSYLRSGFMPVDYDENMTERWTAFLKEFGYKHVEMVDEKGNFVKYLND